MGFLDWLFGRKEAEKTAEQLQAERDLLNMCTKLNAGLEKNKGLSKNLRWEKTLIAAIKDHYFAALLADPAVRKKRQFKAIIFEGKNLFEESLLLIKEVYDRMLSKVLVDFGAKKGIKTYEDLVNRTGFHPEKLDTRGPLFYRFGRPITEDPKEAKQLCVKIVSALSVLEGGEIDFEEAKEDPPNLIMMRFFLPESFLAEAHRKELLEAALAKTAKSL